MKPCRSCIVAFSGLETPVSPEPWAILFASAAGIWIGYAAIRRLFGG